MSKVAIVRWEPFRGMRRWGPFQEIEALQDQVSRLFGQHFGRMGWREEEGVTPATWAPVVDIYETSGQVVLKAELPGLKREDIDIQLHDNILTLKGERKWEKDLQEEHCHLRECAYGTFQRSFTLPAAIRQEGIEAVFRDGVLEIFLPKVEEAKARKIEIRQ